MLQIETLLMKIVRIVAMIFMGLILTVLAFIFIIKAVDWVGSLFQPDTPDVEFYKGDFVNETEIKNLDSDHIRPQQPYEEDFNAFFEELMPKYDSVLNSYVRENADNYRSEKQKADYKSRMRTQFRKQSWQQLRYSVRTGDDSESDEIRESFLDDLIDYMEEAENNGIEPLGVRGYNDRINPVYSLQQSPVFNTYKREFDRQMGEINSRNEKEEGIEGFLKTAGFYAAIFYFLFLFLLLGVLFAIIRIEEHMQSS